MDFLSDLDGNASCPLLIHATPDNRPRWDPQDAFTHFHIFRDRHEKRMLEGRPAHPCVQDGLDWPEIGDELFLIGVAHERRHGGVVDEGDIEAARERLKNITPTSPSWAGPKPWKKAG